MKILKYILGIIVVLAIAFFLLGMVKPEITYDRAVIIEKPVAESWAVMQDEEKLAEWLPGFQKIEHISGTPGTVGAVSDVYFETDGKPMTIRETITNIEENESISMTYESDFMNMSYTMSVAPDNGSTRVSTTTTTVGNGPLYKSMMVLYGGSIKAQEDANLANLKKTIEENTKEYFKIEDESIEIDEGK